MKRGREEEEEEEDHHVDEEAISFQVPTDLTLKGTALNLVSQLSAFIGPFPEDDDESAECENSESDYPKRILRQIDHFQKVLTGVDEADIFSLVLLGRNGDGKSMLLNLLLSITCKPPSQYDRSSETQSHDSQKDIINRLEAVRLLNLTEDADLNVEVQNRRIVFADCDFDDAEMEDESNAMSKIDNVCMFPPDGEKSSFLLPSQGAGVATTQFSMKVRRGEVFQALFLLKSTQEIENELSSINFEKFQDDEDPSCRSNTDEGKELQRLMRIRRLISGSQNAGDDDDSEDDVSVDDAEGGTREIIICDRVRKAIEGGYKIYAGKGKSFEQDRMFVRGALEKMTKDLALGCVVKECIIFCPSDLLRGLELVDTPGTGSDDPLQWKALTDSLAVANGVMIVAQRNLQDNKELKNELVKCGLPEKILKAQSKCPLIVFSAMDEKSNVSTARTFVSSDPKNWVPQKVKSKNRKVIEQILLEEASRPSRCVLAHCPSSMTVQSYVSNVLMAGVDSNLIETRPLLWTSLLKCPSPDPKYLDLETRKAALSKLRGDALLEAFERLDDGWTLKLLSDFVETLKSLCPKCAESSSCQFNDQELNALIAGSCMVWRNAAALIKRDNLLKKCDESINRIILDEVHNIETKFLKDLKVTMLEGVNIEQIREDLKKQIQVAKPSRIQYSFNRMLQGKTKNFNLYNIFFKDLRCPSKDMLGDRIQHFTTRLQQALGQMLVEGVLADLSPSEANRELRSQSAASKNPQTQAFVQHVVQEYLPRELSALFKDLSSHLKPTDRTLDRLFDVACKDSLTKNCLVKAEGLKTKAGFLQLLDESLEQVIDGAADKFCTDLLQNLEKSSKKILKGLLGPRGKFLKLYKCCFKWILEEHQNNKLEKPFDDDMKALVEDFTNVCSELISAKKTNSHDQSACTLYDAIQRCQLFKYLNKIFPALPNECRSKSHRRSTPSKPLPPSEVPNILRQLCNPESIPKNERKGNSLLCAQLGDKLSIGKAAQDCNCLFHTMSQIMRGRDAARIEDHADLRRLVAHVTMERYQASVDAEIFRQTWGTWMLPTSSDQALIAVQEWAERILRDDMHGDVLALDAFAFHFRLNLLLYTPTSAAGPIQLPYRLEGGNYPQRGWVHVVHMPWLNGGRQFAPVWLVQARVSFTPKEDEVRTFNPDPDQEKQQREAYAPIRQREQAIRHANLRPRHIPLIDPELVAAARGLPQGWKVARSRKLAGKIYYHRKGYESRWDRP